jgi:hypothetical protein
VRGEIEDGPPLDSHRSVMLAKVASLLALIDDGRMLVNREDWRLAEMVWDTSCAVRDSVVQYGQRQVESTARARAEAKAYELDPQRCPSDRVVELLAARMARYIVRKHDATGEPVRNRAVREQSQPEPAPGLAHLIDPAQALMARARLGRPGRSAVGAGTGARRHPGAS